MNVNFPRKLYKLNFFILAVLFLLGFAILYFLYFRVRNQAEVYVGVSVTRGTNIPVSAIYNWVPNWLDNAIAIGDQEISPLGGLNATVVDKESYEASFYGRYVYLLLKINAIRDRSGTYLFKNKPLSVGAPIDLKLTNAQITGLVTYVGSDKPALQSKKLLVKLRGLDVEYWIAEAVKVNSVITTSKGEQLAKVLGKNISETSGSVLTRDSNKRNFEVSVELLTKENGGIYYFAETQKVKVDENLFLPFKEVTLNLPITSVTAE